jgi:hypothetical protein
MQLLVLLVTIVALDTLCSWKHAAHNHHASYTSLMHANWVAATSKLIHVRLCWRLLVFVTWGS